MRGDASRHLEVSRGTYLRSRQVAGALAAVRRAKTLTDQLREAVRRSRVTRYRLSQELRIDQGGLSRFVSGERGLSLEAIDRLAHYLGLRLVGRRQRRGRDQ